MLQLKQIVKDYPSGDQVVHALKGVDLSFRDSEFVSVLGPSGCGKTTLLNIIGGLDVYTSGDLVINGRSTKEFKASDWDTYRNHSVGFVFQSYNLIPHQTVLANVELALTLSGVSKAERRRRAAEALEKVGLGDQLKKRPNQMSGGQMQRVAIARALVNDPDILLADEPTGALDTETSVQIMELLKEISKDRLIIMVTHNPALAEEYSSRIVKLLDGAIIDDSNPFDENEVEAALPAARKKAEAERSKGKRSMSFFTALSLSFNNLMTKRARTILTSFAGSIGIIGIALILAVSTGVNAYIASVQRDTLSSYPIQIRSEESDLMSMLGGGGSSDPNDNRPAHENDAVYSNPMLYRMFNTIFAADKKQNNLQAFKAFLDREMNPATATTDLAKYTSAIQYSYHLPLHTFVKNPDGKYVTCSLSEAFGNASQGAGDNPMAGMLSANLSSVELFQEMLPGKDGALLSDMLYEQYDLIYGAWPKEANEIVLILNENNEVSDVVFYALGYISEKEVNAIVSAALTGNKIETEDRVLSYDEVLNISFKLLLPSDYYADRNGDGIFEYIGDDPAIMDLVVGAAYDLKISGILRPNENASAGAMSSPFGYTSALTAYMIEKNNASPVVKAQTDPKNANTNLLSGLPFQLAGSDAMTDEQKAQAVRTYFASLSTKDKAELYKKMYTTPSDAYLDSAVASLMEQYDTREKMIALIADGFNIPASQLEALLSGYTDEQLKELLAEQVRTMVAGSYAAERTAEIETLMNTPSQEELALLLPTIMNSLTTREIKLNFVAGDWETSVTMSREEILAYLTGLDEAALEKAVLSVATKQAAALYVSYKDTPAIAAAREAKVAAAFDASYGNETDTATLVYYHDTFLPSSVSDKTYDEVCTALGVVDAAKPSAINIYATTFADKDNLASIISDYNRSVKEEDAIEYTDYIALLLSGVTRIVNAISYVLIAFVSISLVVSSIMIGIITYISVLERTKEIGVLRSIGASRKDVSRVFNAETIIVGLAAGLLGIGVSLLLCIPINIIIRALSEIDTLSAFLQPLHCVILVAISVILTMVAGLIPSRMAARKDPVEALRSE